MWRFLDELAQSDPEGYKKFIDQQMAEIAAEKKKQADTEALFTPQPAFAIYTRQTKPKESERTIYINICASNQIPPLQTKDRKPARGDESLDAVLIPLSLTRLQSTTDMSGVGVTTTDVVFHPNVIARAEKDMGFKLFMIELALQHIEADEKITLHRAYKFESSRTYVGPSNKPQQQKTESEIEREKFLATMRKDREEKIKSMKTSAGQPIVMPSLAKQTAAKQQYEEESLKELKLRPDQTTAKGEKKKVLIEDITPDQGEEGTRGETKPAATTNSASASSDSKPPIALSSTKSSSAGVASTPALLNLVSSTSINSSSLAPASTSKHDASQSVDIDTAGGKYTSESSVSISSHDLLSSLSSIPVDSHATSWPYGSSSASMQSTESLASAITHKAANAKATPTHTLDISNSQLTIAIHMPLIESVCDVEVDVSASQLKLDSTQYSLTVHFPHPIDECASTAKFVKKKNTLKITAPLR